MHCASSISWPSQLVPRVSAELPAVILSHLALLGRRAHHGALTDPCDGAPPTHPRPSRTATTDKKITTSARRTSPAPKNCSAAPADDLTDGAPPLAAREPSAHQTTALTPQMAGAPVAFSDVLMS